MPIDLFLFDLAGTTVADNGFVTRAFLAAAATGGLGPDPQWVRARMGWRKLLVFQEMLTAAGRDAGEAPALNAAFERHVSDELRREPPRPLAGAPESIAGLRARGAKVGFTTGFSTATGLAILERLGWRPDVFVASDMVDRGRPAPDLILRGMRDTGVTDPRRVGIAGDTPSDLEAGHAAGCRLVVGVGHGSHTLDELRAAPHTHLLPTLLPLLEIIDAL